MAEQSVFKNLLGYFPSMYSVSYQQKAIVNELWDGGDWDLYFRRNLNSQDRLELDKLQRELEGVTPNGERETW